MTPAIEITNLKKTYPGSKKMPPKEALKGVSLSVPRGSFFGLLGPNGAGKSTMINIMAGLVLKTSGEVKICGHDIITDMRAARSALGVVPQELILDTFFTVREALDIHAGYYGVPKAKRRTQEIIDAMGLSDKADVPSRRLSGGMRRRLLVAKALVHSPEVLILDEPTAGVDVELRTQLWDYVKELNRNGTTVLLTTHYLEEAQELCDTIAVINHGEVVAYDSKANMLKMMDSKQLVLTLSEKLAQAPQALSMWQPQMDAEGKLVLTYKPSKESLQDILDAVHGAGLVVRDITTREADLEDVFVHLTHAA
ncbi:MAG: ABC transporter ATP-binding protein [Rickettsiales bacterium]|jgi:ABC-2 type transport system ATP-binding protein|nr:ABC transporter ATP-binding protein [Rickettsiales bacterium]